MTTFVDTSALYALLDDGDISHDAAVETLRTLRKTPLVTHHYVVVETLALAGRRLGWAANERLITNLLPLIDSRPVDGPLHDVALAAYSDARSERVSMVDRTSFAFMRQEGIGRAFAYDADFEREGFRLV